MADIFLVPDESFDENFDGGEANESGDCDTINYQQEEEALSACAKLQKYSKSQDVNYRQVVPALLLEIFRGGTAESISNDLSILLDVIARIRDDNEIGIRMDFVQLIPHLAAAFVEFGQRNPALNQIVVDYLLPVVVNYLSDGDYQVRKSTHATLLTLMEQCLVPRQAIETLVCPVVLKNTHVDDPDQLTDAVVLMGKMVPLLGRDITERLFLARFAKLCSNSMFHIRKLCACCYGEFCAVVGRTAYENILLPCFIELCSDTTWAVRKACAEVVTTVSCACTPQLRRSVLAPAFSQLLQDQSRWVRMSAFQTLGPFISTFADPSIIGLAYNQMGELVLINPSGTEFKINSPVYIDANLKASADFKQLLCVLPDPDINKKDTSLLEQQQQQSEQDFQQSDDTENIKTEIIVENHAPIPMPYTNTELLNEIDENTNTTMKTTTTQNNNIEIVIEEINDSIATATETTKTNNNQTQLLDEESVVKTIQELSLDDDGGGIVEEHRLDDDLNQYNLYQYWYVSPDLPLDPQIVQSCGKTANRLAEEKTNFHNQLDGIHFNNSWYLEKTLTFDPSLVEQYLPKSVKAEKNEAQKIVPQFLIDHFVSMTDAELANTDNDMPYHCAYSLPAVALTLGKENWRFLTGTCVKLASNVQYKIRKIVASSLHELALILGQEMTTEYLLPIFDGFIKDLDEVRIGVVKNLAHFLKLIGPKKRNCYLPRLADFLKTDRETNWRFREELANQLLIAVPLFPASNKSRIIALLSLDILCDKVCAVRKVALLLVTEIIRHFSVDATLTSWLLVILAEEFAHSKRWVRRQTFALLCSRLIENNALPPEQFATDVMLHLLDLSWDPVPNVRLAVSRTITTDIIVHDYFSDVNSEHHESINMVLRRLQADKDRDVRQFAILPVH